MYASLVGAGVSKLYDLLQSATSSSTSSSDSSFSVPSTSSSSATPTTSTSSGSLSSDLNQLFLDLQASKGNAVAGTVASTATSGSAGGTGSVSGVANDLQSVFGDLSKSVGGHGHRHHHSDGNGGGGQSAAATSGSTTAASGSANGSPFQGLASSLRAYSNSQGLTAGSGSTTSLTA